MALINQNLTDVKEQQGVIPAGEYRVSVFSSEVKQAKSSGAAMATFAFQLTGNAALNGLLIWDHFVLNNSVAQSRLKALAVAAGHPNPNFIKDTEELHGRTLLVRVTVTKDDTYGEQNRITAFKKIKDASSAADATGAALPPPPPSLAAAAPKGKTPWDKPF
jgi:hypothetical protein